MDIGIAVFGGCEGLTDPGRSRPRRRGARLRVPVLRRAHPHPGGEPARRWPVGAGLRRNLRPIRRARTVAGVTTTLKLGTAVCLVPERDPIITAKEVSSLDRVSDGRFLFGVGAGWNREELANHGTERRRRMAVLEDRVRAMRAIWTADEAEYHGRFVDFDPLWSWPKPLQRPHPPVLVGGNGPGTEDRVPAFGDGWLPQWGLLRDMKELADRITALRRRVADLAQAPVPVTLFGAVPDTAMLRAFSEAGVDRCLFVLGQGLGTDLDTLDRWAELLRHNGP
ncbi:MAG: TIGR03619 family F420-dependent LLM class oxidoreductase [Nocardioidaceae bacterium]